MRPRRWLATVSLCLLVLFALPGGASASASGPPLSVPRADLEQALRCSGDVDHARREPVLLVPGTTLQPDQFDWNYVPVLKRMGIPFCTLTLPGNAMADIQVAGEHVVHAIRSMHADSGREVQILGHSQGGMVPRWALKFWPDTREKVDDLVGLAPSNHGTLDSYAVCAPGCSPAFHQQALTSKFLGALNGGAETHEGISYTNVSSNYDEVVTPNIGDAASSALHTGRGDIANIATQDLCPLDVADHLLVGSADPVASALAVDALTHPGPADPERVPRDVCGQLLMPGVDPVTFPTDFAGMAGTAADQVLLYPKVLEEPPLKPYARSSESGHDPDSA